ncbi:hypothetical protein CRUP_009862 [Coryphaenoides rupestris]|nr:hypothetical protein CRUP_009862 [Coryphaenoides rupestris]
MSAQKDCEFLVRRARELVSQDPCAAKAWLITGRTLYPADFNIQYEMYTIERNAERTASAGRLLYDMFINFPDQPVVWREISVITGALRSDCQDKHAQFLRGLFETLPGRVQCEMLLKATEQCFNTLEKAEMLLLLLKRFPESVVQHGVNLGETLLEAEVSESLETPVNCFRKLFVCEVLPLIINNVDMRLPASLLQKYVLKAAEFYISYVARSPSADGQMQGTPEVGSLKSPNAPRGTQRYVIDGLSEKSSVVAEPWERLLDILTIVGARCEWQGDKGQRSYVDMLQRVKELCRYLPSLEGDTRSRCCSQVVICSVLVLFRSALLYASTVQPALFQGLNALSSGPWILLEDLSSVYSDVELDRAPVKHGHKKRKLADGREKPMGQYRKALSSLHQMTAVQQQPPPGQQSPSGQASLESSRALIQQASCHYALGEYRMACEKVLDVVSGLVPPNHEPGKTLEQDQGRAKSKSRKGQHIVTDPRNGHHYTQLTPDALLRVFTDSRDDLSLGHVVVLLQQDWPLGESLFLKALEKICQQASFQNPSGPALGGAELNTLLLQGVQTIDSVLSVMSLCACLCRHHTVTRGITKGVKEDFRLAMERQVSRCSENLLGVLHRFCLNEKIMIIQCLP